MLVCVCKVKATFFGTPFEIVSRCSCLLFLHLFTERQRDLQLQDGPFWQCPGEAQECINIGFHGRVVTCRNFGQDAGQWHFLCFIKQIENRKLLSLASQVQHMCMLIWTNTRDTFSHNSRSV